MNLKDKVLLIKHIELFKGLSEAELEFIAEKTVEERIKPMKYYSSKILPAN